MIVKETNLKQTLNRKKAPAIIDTASLHLTLPPYRHFKLNNGVDVYAVHGGTQDVFQAEWVFYAGNSYETSNNVAPATNSLLKNGTKKHSAFELNEQFEYYGAYLTRSCYNETAVINLSGLNKHLESLLPVVRELITEAVFPEEELAIYTQNAKQRLLVNLKKCDYVANRLIDAQIYGEAHPYGKYSRAEDYDALTAEQLRQFYKTYYQEGKCVLFLAGLLPDNLELLLNNYFGDLPLHGAAPEKVYPLAPAAQKKSRIQNDPDGVQGAIRLARPFPNRHHPDFQKVQVLNNVFGGFFGSRLMSNIREDKGYTYGIYSYIQNHIGDTAWAISTEAGTGVCEATVQEVYKEMNILREELIDDEELQLVRNFMMGSLLGDLDGPFQVMSRWKNIILNNLDETYFNRSIEVIKTISAQELRDLAQKYLVDEDFYEMVVV